MSTPAQIAAATLDAETSSPQPAPPRQERQEPSPQSSTFIARDFVRPHEQSEYDQLGASLRHDLAPVGILEHNLVDEIHRAIWRLERCGKVEATMILSGPDGVIPDPMQQEAQAKLQFTVDRARSQAHRLLHKCTAELRKLQTGRKYRDETFEAGHDITDHGIEDWRSIHKGLDEEFQAGYRRRKFTRMAEIDAFLSTPLPPPVKSSSFCKTESATSRAA